ncbi:MAG TPA: ATP-binding protein [Labilithrix sp.]|nr:ATP-binding protein [Labilithrix sp.]
MSARRRKNGPTQATRRTPEPSPVVGLAPPIDEQPSIAADLVQAHRRLEHLYEISKLLTRFESIDRTVPAAIEVVARTLPLRSAILTRQAQGGCRMLVWPSEAIHDDDRHAATTHLRSAHAYLVSPGGEACPEMSDAGMARAWASRSTPAKDSRRFIVLPLAVDHRAAFGVLQLEGAATLDESDLVFVNAVVNQLAIALDRQATIELEQAAAEGRKRDAEERQLVAERAKARAEELEAMANAARREAERMRDLTSTVTQGMAEGVLAVNVDGRITLLNPAAARMLGWSEHEALGQRVEDVLRVCGSDGVVVPAERSPLRLAMESSESVRNEDQWFVARQRRHFAVGYTASALSRGERTSGAVLVFRDVMGVKRAEREQRLLAELSARLASAIGARATLKAISRFAVPLVADLCVVDEVDPHGDVGAREVVFADESKHWLLAEGMKGFAPEQSWHTPQAKALATGRSFLLGDVLESEIDEVAGGEAHARFLREVGLRSMMVVPLSAYGQRLGILTCAFLDSDRRYTADDRVLIEEVGRRAALAIHNARLYEQAKKATQARDELLAMVSHDLRNPLSVILATISMMSSVADSEDVSRAAKQLPRIKRAAETMDHLISDLLDTASIESGTLSVARVRLAVGPVVREVVETMQLQAGRKALHLTSEIPSDLPPVIADAGRLEQVLVNLVGNAIKFTQDGGEVVIRAESYTNAIRFSVTDTGPGIPEADIPHLFERFWQSGPTARLGTGLGLAIVKGIVEAHGGSVWAESKVGLGSSFFFTLPSAPPATHEHGTAIH